MINGGSGSGGGNATGNICLPCCCGPYQCPGCCASGAGAGGSTGSSGNSGGSGNDGASGASGSAGGDYGTASSGAAGNSIINGNHSSVTIINNGTIGGAYT